MNEDITNQAVTFWNSADFEFLQKEITEAKLPKSKVSDCEQLRYLAMKLFDMPKGTLSFRAMYEKDEPVFKFSLEIDIYHKWPYQNKERKLLAIANALAEAKPSQAAWIINIVTT